MTCREFAQMRGIAAQLAMSGYPVAVVMILVPKLLAWCTVGGGGALVPDDARSWVISCLPVNDNDRRFSRRPHILRDDDAPR